MAAARPAANPLTPLFIRLLQDGQATQAVCDGVTHPIMLLAREHPAFQRYDAQALRPINDAIDIHSYAAEEALLSTGLPPRALFERWFALFGTHIQETRQPDGAVLMHVTGDAPDLVKALLNAILKGTLILYSRHDPQTPGRQQY